MLRLVPDAAMLVDGTGRIVAANRLAEQLFGYPSGGLTGSPVEGLLPARYRTRHVGHRHGYVSRPSQRPMGAGLDLWGLRRGGAEFPIDISLTPMEVAGRVLTMAAIRDMSLQRAEWAAEARLAGIVASSEDAMMSMDLSGTLVTWNPGAEHLFGWNAGEAVGRSYWRLVPPDLRSQAEERMARVRSGLRVPPLDTRRVKADAQQVDVAESMSLVTDVSGEPAGFAAVLRDITERKQAELELRRLLAESQRRERWLTAISEVRLTLFSGADQRQWLDLITRRVEELIDADGVLVALPHEARSELLTVAATRGHTAVAQGASLPVDGSLSGRVFRSGQSVVSGSRLGDSPVSADLLEDGPAVIAPMVSSAGPTGVLLVTRLPGRPSFGTEDIRLVESFAQQAGIGIELARAQSERAQFAMVADRERIARDLHDHVIQRLFAVGMSLQAAANAIGDPRVLERIEESVEELDATIRDVRSTIFSLELRATEHVETSTRSRILDVASMAAQALGFQPRLQFEGAIDTRVPEGLVPDLLAVVREALSNTARHAEATTVQVHVTAGPEHLRVEVVDDGKGAEGRTRSSGLGNLQARAESRGGAMEVGAGRKGKGTRILWQVPLPG